MSGKRAITLLASACALAGVAVPLAAAADGFYKGKTLTLIVGTIAGGGYDANGRLVARHIGRFIPGAPNVVVQNMPGASGIKAVNFLYAIAPKDGTTIATFNSAMPFYETVGASGVQFKSTELSWIGSLSQNVNVIVVMRDTGVRTLEDAKKKEVIMGALTGGGTMSAYPILLNNLFGTKFKVVAGYSGGNEVNLAIERGEVQGRGTTPWSTWKTTRPEWVKDGRVVPLVQIGPKKDPELAAMGVPLLDDLAENEEQRQIFRLLGGNTYIERPFAGPPRIPADRLEILRRAFDAVAKDPQFLADAEREQAEVDPQTGENVALLVKQIVGSPAAVIERVKAVMPGGAQ